MACWELGKNLLSTLFMMTVRFGLALLVGFLVSYPAELALFRPEINMILAKERTEARLRANALIANDPTLKTEKETLLQQKRELRQEIEARRKETQKLYEEFKDESEGTAGTMRFGHGPVAKQKEERYREAQAQFAAVEKRDLAEIDAIDAGLASLEQMKQERVKAMDEKQANANGILARASALHRLMHERPVVAWIKWAITLILLLLECIPLLTKLSSSLSKDNAYQAKALALRLPILQKSQVAEEQLRSDAEAKARERAAEENAWSQSAVHRSELIEARHRIAIDAEKEAARRQKELKEAALGSTLQKQEAAHQIDLTRIELEWQREQQDTEEIHSALKATLAGEIEKAYSEVSALVIDKWRQEQAAQIRQIRRNTCTPHNLGNPARNISRRPKATSEAASQRAKQRNRRYSTLSATPKLRCSTRGECRWGNSGLAGNLTICPPLHPSPSPHDGCLGQKLPRVRQRLTALPSPAYHKIQAEQCAAQRAELGGRPPFHAPQHPELAIRARCDWLVTSLEVWPSLGGAIADAPPSQAATNPRVTTQSRLRFRHCDCRRVVGLGSLGLVSPPHRYRRQPLRRTESRPRSVLLRRRMGT